MTYRITIAYVHPGFVRHEFFDSILHTIGDGRYEVTFVRVESGVNIQQARNQCVREFLQHDSDYMFSVDTDMQWDPDAPARLIEKNLPIVSALYLGRGEDGRAFPVGQAWADPYQIGVGPMRGVRLPEIDYRTLEVAAVGMGCCIIRREVFEALGTQGHEDTWPFAQGEAPTPNGTVAMGEDVTFCVRARAHEKAFRSYIAGDVRAGHVKSFVMTPPAPEQASVLQAAVVRGNGNG